MAVPKEWLPTNKFLMLQTKRQRRLNPVLIA